MELGEAIDLLQQMVLVFSSEEIVSEFGRFKPNGTTGTIGNLFVDLCTSLICSARLAAWNIGEQTLAEEQLPEVITQMRSLNQEKLLFIYDRLQ